MRTLIAGGGTGGHLTPVLAVAQELRRTDPTGAVLVVGRDGGVAESLVRDAGMDLQTLRISGLDVSSPVSVARFAGQLPAAVWASRRLLRRFGPDVVIGGAGYVSVPVVLAAQSLRVPVVLLEQNALPGRATRVLARRARVVAAAFAETAAHLPGARVVQTGNPIRAQVLAVVPRPLGDACERLLVMGGSQGARRINRALAGAVTQLLSAHPQLHITHQTGALDIAAARSVAAAMPAELAARYVVSAFIDDVGAAINEADLVLMRAGGSSLAECAALGRPMILVPYPHAGDHQRHNAAPYVAAGAARVLSDDDCEASQVIAEVERVLADPSGWRIMAAASASHAHRDAAARVVSLLGEVTGAPVRMPR